MALVSSPLPGLMRWTALLIAAPNNRIMALHVPAQEAVHLIRPVDRQQGGWHADLSGHLDRINLKLMITLIFLMPKILSS